MRDYDFVTPFKPAARKLLNEPSKLSIRAAQWVDYEQEAKHFESQSEFRPRFSTRPLDMRQPKRARGQGSTAFAQLLEDLDHLRANGNLFLRQSLNVEH